MVTVPAFAILYPSLLATLARNPNYTVFPDANGVPHVIDLRVQLLSLQDLEELQANLDQIRFTLHTRKNRAGEELTIGDVATIANSEWDSMRPTRIITHGWRGDAQVESCTTIRDAFLDVGDYNVILIDWGAISGSLLYGKVVSSVPAVAKRVAQMIDFLADAANLHAATTKIIGHSLGAHVAGLAALNAAGRVAEVVALDPAKPLYESASAKERVDAIDAEHVQVIHTNAGQLGIQESIGTSDFYPNNGSKQPGCSFVDIFGACSHSRSYLYYAESVRNPVGFPGTLYGRRTSLGGSEQAYMGGPSLDSSAKGSYVVKTKPNPPFAID